jgi:soluble lytic murein transglycosylase-like protein
MLKRLGKHLTLGLVLMGVPAEAGEMLASVCVTRISAESTGRAGWEAPRIPDADGRTERFAREMTAVGRAVGIDPALLRAVVMQESSGNPNAVSEAGAIGLTQLMPVAIRQYAAEAASMLGRPVDARSALDNLLMGALYYRDALRRTHGNVEAAARLYHGGPNHALHGPRTVAYGKAVAWRYRRMTAAVARPAA